MVANNRFDSRKANRAAEGRGLRAEKTAALYLRLKGYRVIARRERTPVGEIDLIAQKGSLLCFVEVKFRRTIREALASISPWQRRRIERAALYYCQGQGLSAETLRFDVIALAPYRLPRHIPNAWRQ